MLKVGIIGLGAIADIHIKAILNTEAAKITCVCDIVKDKAQSLAKQFNVNAYTDYKEMIDTENPDVVHICTPHYLHAQMAIYALEKGSNIYLEKPVAMYYEEAMQVKKTHIKSGKAVCVSLQNRCNETVKAAHKIIKSNLLGKVLGIKAILAWKRTGDYYLNSDWRGKWDKEGGGLLMNQAIHTLDLMNLFSGSRPAVVHASIANRANIGIIEEEDTAEAFIEYENGVRGIFFGTNGFTKNDNVHIEIHCEKGSMSLFKNKLYLYTNEESKIIATDEVMNGEKSYWGLGHKFLILDFYNHLLGKGGEYVGIDEGIEALLLCDMIYKAAKRTN
ncbi:MAG: Gfo/Idh/MocA family oxidoreductase [Clostridia bacterium]|nr:Gfo/Idh/MocA family oxidoreductase [Clostridia bacterium]